MRIHKAEQGQGSRPPRALSRGSRVCSWCPSGHSRNLPDRCKRKQKVPRARAGRQELPRVRGEAKPRNRCTERRCRGPPAHPRPHPAPPAKPKSKPRRVRPSLRNSIALEEQTQSYLNEKIIQHPTRNSTPSRKQGGEPRPELQTSVPHGRGPEPHPQSDPWPASPPGRGVRGHPFLTLADPIPSLSPKTGPG